jgi:hypothetical protein
MKCSRCARELAENATYCPGCGLNVTQSQPRMFSYLPPGIPPWPISVPDGLPYAVTGEAGTYAVAQPIASEQQGGRRNLLTTIAVLLLIPLLGASTTFGILYFNNQLGKTETPSISHISSPQVSSSEALPTPAAFKDTEAKFNDALKASLKYPADWVVGPLDQSTTDIIVLPLLSEQIGIQIYVQRISGQTASTATVTPAEINSARLQDLAQKYSGAQQVTAQNAKPTIGGDLWDESEATFTDPQSTQTGKIHYTTIAVKHKTEIYTIQALALDSTYQEALQKYIQPILTSFKFLA